jgi:anti-sigma factor RsiW
MTCEETLELLDDYVDGALVGAAFHTVELHLASCASCREEERLLRELLAEAEALPDEVDLPRDLWPGIATRIKEEGRFKLLRGPWRTPLGLAAAATLVMGLSFAWWARHPGQEAPTQVAAMPSGRPVQIAAGTLPDDLVEAEREYARATAELMAALDKRRGEIAPETVASVEENLRRIDVALAEVRTALRQDPDSPQLTRLLTSTHRKKLQTLQHVMRLSQKS